MFSPVWQGFPIDQREHRRTKRRRRAFWNCVKSGEWTYVATSPCHRFVKVGTSKYPDWRIVGGSDFVRAREALGCGFWYVTRLYEGGRLLEAECHRFLRPERIYRREWYRVGPRVRILIARLDRFARVGKRNVRADLFAAVLEDLWEDEQHESQSEAA